MLLNCFAACATVAVVASVAPATATVAPAIFMNFLRSLAIFSSLRICRHQYFRRPLNGMRPRRRAAKSEDKLAPLIARPQGSGHRTIPPETRTPEDARGER